MYDFHIHSIFSPDCRYSLEKMVKSGISKKMKIMYAADHFELRDNPDDDMIFDLSEYIKEIRRINRKYSNVEILAGLELSTDKTSCGRFSRIKDTYLGDEIFRDTEQALELYTEYYNGILETIQVFDDFNVLCHLDLIDKFKQEYFIELGFSRYKSVVAEILNEIIKRDKTLEVNTAGFREDINRLFPRVEILTMYKKMGGNKIIIGSDAHLPEHVAYENKKAQSILKKIGLNNLCVYRNGKPHLIKY